MTGPATLLVSGTFKCVTVGDEHYPRPSGLRLGDKLTVELRPEPSNRHDRNAVAVSTNGSTIGYLSRSTAARFQPVLLKASRSGYVVTTVATFEEIGGSPGLRLRLPWPDELAERLALAAPADPRIRDTGRPDPTKGGMVAAPIYELGIVCTGKGQHKRTRLTTARWFADDGRPVLDEVHGRWDADRTTDRTAERPWTWTWRLLGTPGARPAEGETRVFEFRCPRCTHRPRRPEALIEALFDAARREKLPEFDVSRLD